MKLANGTLIDAKGRTGYIASYHEWSFECTVPGDAIHAGDWSICEPNGWLAFGSNTTFYSCFGSGKYNDFYDEDIGSQCFPLNIAVHDITATSDDFSDTCVSSTTSHVQTSTSVWISPTTTTTITSTSTLRTSVTIEPSTSSLFRTTSSLMASLPSASVYPASAASDGTAPKDNFETITVTIFQYETVTISDRSQGDDSINGLPAGAIPPNPERGARAYAQDISPYQSATDPSKRSDVDVRTASGDIEFHLNNDTVCGLKPDDKVSVCWGNPHGDCCSVFGYCGSGREYCAPKCCNAAWGYCDADGVCPEAVPASSNLAVEPPAEIRRHPAEKVVVSEREYIEDLSIAEEGTCGYPDNRVCSDHPTGGQCCSKWGWCGDGPHYCSPTCCDADWGYCNQGNQTGDHICALLNQTAGNNESAQLLVPFDDQVAEYGRHKRPRKHIAAEKKRAAALMTATPLARRQDQAEMDSAISVYELLTSLESAYSIGTDWIAVAERAVTTTEVQVVEQIITVSDGVGPGTATLTSFGTLIPESSTIGYVVNTTLDWNGSVTYGLFSGSPVLPLKTYTTLTDPLNANATSIQTDPCTSATNNISIDTESFINISTFVASGLSIPAPSATGSTSPSSSIVPVTSSVPKASPSTKPSGNGMMGFTSGVTMNAGTSSIRGTTKTFASSMVVGTSMALAACFALALLW